MKHLSPLLFTLLPGLVVGQQPSRSAYPMHPDRGQYPATDVRMPLGAPRAVEYYSETFDSDLNGWTPSAAQGSLVWAWTNAGPGPTSSTYPVPALNTTGGWAIIDDDFLGQSGQSTNQSLVSPVIDLTEAPANLKLEFDQYFQEFQNDHCFVGVSTDGGTTWNEVEVNEGVGRDGRPNPERIDINISDWVSADPAHVQVRFRYASTWDYGWQIDNVSISDLPNNDVALVQPRQTSFYFDPADNSALLENIDYSIYAMEQVRPMLLHTKVRNKGFLAQHNVVFHVSVTGPGGGEVFSGSSTAIDMLEPSDEDSVAVEGFTPDAEGEYVVNYSVTQDETDEIADNNTATTHFAVSDCIWASDDGSCQQYQNQGLDFEDEAMEVGNFFDPVGEESVLYGLDVAIYENSTPGAFIYGIVRSNDADNTPLAMTDDHELLSEELSGIGEAKFIRLPLSEPFPLTAGEPVLLMVGGYGGSDEVNPCTSGLSDPQVSIIFYPESGANPNIFFTTKTPMVRAVLDPNCAGAIGIAELAAQVENVQVAPNPFNEATDLRFTLKEAAGVRITLQDVTGRVVMQQDLGKLPAGAQRFRIDGSQLGQAAYSYTITVNGRRISGMLVHQR